MNKRKRAPGGGRKPLDPSGSDIVMIRLPPDLRRSIERLAKKRGRNRADVIRSALKHWVGRHQVRTLHTEALTCAIALLADRIEQRTGKKWIEDAVTGAALREQVERLIFHFAPTPAEPAVVPPEADVVGLVLTMIEHTVQVKGVPAVVTFSDDRGLSEILRDLARQPPHGLGSGWQRNRTIWERNWVKS
jgi:Arc/MetJ-type ribon-helix-helix transcriptional regulator